MILRLAFAATLVALPAIAGEPPETPVATAAAEPTVAEQIDAYLRSSPVLELDEPGPAHGLLPRPGERRARGEVSVAVGTGGYRSVYARTDMPLGDSGHVSLAFGDTRYGRAYGGFRGDAFAAGGQRCGLEAMTPARPLDAMGGPHGRCAGPSSRPW